MTSQGPRLFSTACIRLDDCSSYIPKSSIAIFRNLALLCPRHSSVALVFICRLMRHADSNSDPRKNSGRILECEAPFFWIFCSVCLRGTAGALQRGVSDMHSCFLAESWNAKLHFSGYGQRVFSVEPQGLYRGECGCMLFLELSHWKRQPESLVILNWRNTRAVGRRQCFVLLSRVLNWGVFFGREKMTKQREISGA